MPTSVCFDHLINIIDDALLSNVKESGGGGMGGLVDALDPHCAVRNLSRFDSCSEFLVDY